MADFSSTICIGGWIERPFSHLDGGDTHKLYHLECVVFGGNYSTLALSATLADAAAAGVQALPANVGPDATAYFVKDSAPQPFKGPIVKFTRTFATVPDTITIGEEVSHTFPGFRAWNEGAITITAAEEYYHLVQNRATSPTPPIEKRPPLSLNLRATVTLTFAYSTNSGANISSDALFKVNQGAGPSVVTIDTLGTYYVKCPALDEVDYVCDDARDYSDPNNFADWPETNPSLSTYQSRVSSGTLMTIESKVSQYMGRIYQKRKVAVPYK